MVLKKGSRGKLVKELQEFLGITADGIFGTGTENAVKAYQNKNGLYVDGIVGRNTWDAMGLATTDASDRQYETNNGLVINVDMLPLGEYKVGPTNKEYLFLHHTGGWDDPYKQVGIWANDTRGSVGTEFLIGGQSVKTGRSQYDGEVVQCIPEGGYGWHLGRNGSQHMHEHSVGIELCNFGQLENSKTWSGATAHPLQIATLDKPFRGFATYHKYSDDQLKSLKKLIVHIANRDSIDVRDGVISEIKKHGIEKAFSFNEDAFYGKIKGMLLHVNTRTDKFDLSPQINLIDMLLTI